MLKLLKLSSFLSKQVFPNKIDAVLGGLLIAYKLTGMQQPIGKLFDRFLMLFSGLSHPHFLSYVMGYLGQIEATWWIIQWVFVLLVCIFIFYLPSGTSFIKTVAIRFLKNGVPMIFLDMVYFYHGWRTLNRIVSYILNFLTGFLGMIKAAYDTASFWEQIGIIASLGASSFAAIISILAELLTDSISGGLVTAGKIAACAGDITFNAILFYNDYIDFNDIVG